MMTISLNAASLAISCKSNTVDRQVADAEDLQFMQRKTEHYNYRHCKIIPSPVVALHKLANPAP